MLIRFIQFRPIFLTLWFLAYFIWVQPLILERLVQAPHEKNIALGLFLLGVQVFELLGVWLKYPGVFARIQANRSQSWTQFLSFLLVLTHMMITALLAFSTIKLFGIDWNKAGLIQGLAGLALFFAALAKEGVFLSGWFGLLGGKITPLPASPKAISPAIADMLGDGLLAIFSALAYTVVWEQTVAEAFVIRSTYFHLVLDYAGAVLFFLMVFPATRILYYTEELLRRQPRANVILSWTLLLLTMISALLTIPTM